ncbi:MAG: ComF family protein [Verrucomicrobia bacterium]|nr:ComF family protein [Verrucomicrobiota bacterium]
MHRPENREPGPGGWWREAGGRLADLLYPRLCPGCGDPLSAEAFPALCEPCRFRLHPLEAPFCEICGEKFHGLAQGPMSCWNCRGRALAFDFARSGYHAHELVRELIHRLKYGREIALSRLLGQLLLRNWEDRRVERHRDWILVPVPLHPRRERERQFNQSDELCRVVSAETGLPRLPALRRVRATTAQASLDQESRLENLKDAFVLVRQPEVLERIEGKRILLVDDVFTTGATTHECAKVLKAQGKASMVAVITVARAGTPPLG